MFDSSAARQWIKEADSIVSMVGTVMSEGSGLSSSDLYDIAEQLGRARNLILRVGDRKYLIEKLIEKEVA